MTKVKSELLKLPDVLSAELSLPDEAVITMQQHIPLSELKNAVVKAGHYAITENGHVMSEEETKGWFATYRPLLLIFFFLLTVSVLASFRSVNFAEDFMRFFMAGFFLTFSFFKFLDLNGFANAYTGYDLLAMKVPVWGKIYPFVEFFLGIAYLSAFLLPVTNILNITVMVFSSIGVIRSVVNKKQIQCACLGTVFNLPMSTVTIIEDLLMVGMAAGMLLLM